MSKQTHHLSHHAKSLSTVTYDREIEIGVRWRQRRLRGLELTLEAGPQVVGLRAYTERGAEPAPLLKVPVEDLRRLARALERLADEAGMGFGAPSAA